MSTGLAWAMSSATRIGGAEDLDVEVVAVHGDTVLYCHNTGWTVYDESIEPEPDPDAVAAGITGACERLGWGLAAGPVEFEYSGGWISPYRGWVAGAVTALLDEVLRLESADHRDRGPLRMTLARAAAGIGRDSALDADAEVTA